MEYEIGHDRNDDGVIEDDQWNTFDLAFFGPNTFVGALYLAALRAAARMADLQGDRAFAKRCRVHRRQGEPLDGRQPVERRVLRPANPRRCARPICNTATAVWPTNYLARRGPIRSIWGICIRSKSIRTALKSVYRYNWAPDVAAQNQAHPPQRWFARPGDAGLFTCTWPKGGRMSEPVLYRDEVWTGTEYQVASALLNEGLIREGLSIIRGIDDRYDGRRHNPWNEVECGDHYARAMASWGCLISLSGLLYDGPAGRIGFAPRWQARQFQGLFFCRARVGNSAPDPRAELADQQHRRQIRIGASAGIGFRVARQQKAQPTPESKSRAGSSRSKATQTGQRVEIRLDEPVVMNCGRDADRHTHLESEPTDHASRSDRLFWLFCGVKKGTFLGCTQKKSARTTGPNSLLGTANFFKLRCELNLCRADDRSAALLNKPTA